MVQAVTVAILQTIVALVAIVANAGLQSYAYYQLNKMQFFATSQDTKKAQRLLVGSMAMQYIAAILMTVALIVLFVHREKLKAHMSKMIYFVLFVSGSMLLIGGVISAILAVNLQCPALGNKALYNVWRAFSSGAIVGVIGPMLLLAIQAFVHRSKLADKARYYLTTEDQPRKATHLPVFNPTNLPPPPAPGNFPPPPPPLPQSPGYKRSFQPSRAPYKSYKTQ